MDYRLVLFCILLTSLPMLAQSQTDEFNHEWKQNGDIQFGVFGGFAENRIVYSDWQHSATSFQIGGQSEYFIDNHWSIKTKLTYENRNYGFNIKGSVLSVPVLTNFHFGKNRRWNIHAGLAYSKIINNLHPGIDGFAYNVGIGVIIPVKGQRYFIEIDGLINIANAFYVLSRPSRSAINFGYLF